MKSDHQNESALVVVFFDARNSFVFIILLLLHMHCQQTTAFVGPAACTTNDRYRVLSTLEGTPAHTPHTLRIHPHCYNTALNIKSNTVIAHAGLQIFLHTASTLVFFPNPTAPLSFLSCYFRQSNLPLGGISYSHAPIAPLVDTAVHSCLFCGCMCARFFPKRTFAVAFDYECW